MDTQEISLDTQKIILGSIEPLTNWQQAGPFCVDGRDGSAEMTSGDITSHLFAQALGGSLNITLVHFLANTDFAAFSDAQTKTMAALQNTQLSIGVHRGSHAHAQTSDCGFADNMAAIVGRLAKKADEIKAILETATPVDEALWKMVIERAQQRSPAQLYPTGESMISQALEADANLQTLNGDHAEVAAVVNLKPETTLNTGALVKKGLQAFNIDLWYVAEQATALGLDANFASLASLGLYVATEMVLVEDKKQVRLPILINS